MEPKTFRAVTTVSMTLTATAALLSIVGIAATGFYPGIIVLLLLVLVPVASKIYAKKTGKKSAETPGNYFTLLTIVNLLTVFVVLWMTFVILHDRVLGDCC